MNVGELKKMLAEYQDHVDVVMMDGSGRIFEIDLEVTDRSNNDPCGGYFEPTDVLGLVAGEKIPRSVYD